MSDTNGQTRYDPSSDAVDAEAILAQQLTPFTVKADFGHGYAKAICGDRKTIFSTAISGVRADEANFTSVRSATNRQFVIEVNGQPFAIGDDALEKRRNVARRLDQSGMGGDLHKIIMLAAFTQVVPLDGYVRLITQIPISWFSQRDQMYKLAGSYAVTYNGRTCTYLLERKNIVLKPEGYGALCAYCFDADGNLVEDFKDQRIVVLDCGTKTTNVAMFKGMKFVADQSFSIAAGISDMWKHCQGIINRDYKRQPHLDDIDRALRDNKGILPLGAEDINLWDDPYAPTGIRQVSSAIISEIQNNLEGGSLARLFLGSGGAWPYLETYIRKAFGKQVAKQSDYVTTKSVKPWMMNVIGLDREELFRERTQQLANPSR